MSELKVRRVLALALVGAIAAGLGVGCDTGNPTPVSPNASTKTPVPIDEQPGPDFQFFQDVWEAVYNTPFSSSGRNLSFTYVDEEVDTVDLYSGVNNAGEPFTLDLSEVDYYDQAALIALDTDGTHTATILQYNLTASLVRGRYSGPVGSLDLYGIVRSWDANAIRIHFYQPVDYDEPLPLLETLTDPTVPKAAFDVPKAPFDGGVVWNPSSSPSSDCDGSWMGCNENSDRPEKPEVTCPPGKTMLSGCEEDCAGAYDQAITDAIEAGCKKLCEAAEELESDLKACRNSALAAGALAAAGTFTVSGPFGLAVLVAGDGLLVQQYQSCKNSAWEQYGDHVGQAQEGFTQDVDTAQSNYESCAADCCVDDLIEIEDGYEMIGH